MKEAGAWLEYINLFVAAYARGKALGLAAGGSSVAAGEGGGEISGTGGMLLCSPHPDDELLTGALPYRLLRQTGLAVGNLIITLGSDPRRREERRAEVAAACGAIGFAWQLVLPPLAFSEVTPRARAAQATAWAEKVAILARHFDRLCPALVLCPHAEDGHQTHRGVHLLVLEALALHSAGHDRAILLVESEFWQPMAEPNLMVGIAPEDAARLLAALTQHRGELRRNPYHLRQPARWMDNVRRGGELLGGYGGGGADFPFAELYRLSCFRQGEQRPWSRGSLLLAPDQRLELAALRQG